MGNSSTKSIPREEPSLKRREHPSTDIFQRDYLVMRPLIDWIREVATGYVNGTLVDYGCGNKPYLIIVGSKVGKYIGVDLAQNETNTVDVVLGDGSPLPFEKESVDTVLSTQVLEHVSEPERYLAEVARVLRKGGIFILTCPGSYMLHEEPHDFYRYTEHGLKYLLQRHNLEPLRIDTAGGAWRLIGQTFLNHKAFGRRTKIPILGGVFYYFWVISANILFSLLDHMNLNTKDTVNYMVVARKAN
jgi:SAM-dependent methyltransferase